MLRVIAVNQMTWSLTTTHRRHTWWEKPRILMATHRIPVIASLPPNHPRFTSSPCANKNKVAISLDHLVGNGMYSPQFHLCLWEQIKSFHSVISSPYLSHPLLDCASQLSMCGNSHLLLCICSAAACRRTLAYQKEWVQDLKSRGTCQSFITFTFFHIFKRPTHPSGNLEHFSSQAKQSTQA